MNSKIINKKIIGIAVIPIIMLVYFAAGCATVPVEKQPGPKNYYNKALKEMQGGWLFGADYEQVRGTLNRIIDNYPYSTYAMLAQLRIADTYYKGDMYIEAAEAYDHFVKMYPNSKHIPYAIFMEGKSFLENQKAWLTGSIPYDIDSTGIYNALDEFRYIIENYPSSEYTNKARKYAKQCEHALAEHDMYVADFYIRQDHYEAAINRLEDVYRNYPQSGIADEALYRLAMIYRKINLPEKYKQTVKLLRQLYPKSSYGNK